MISFKMNFHSVNKSTSRDPSSTTLSVKSLKNCKYEIASLSFIIFSRVPKKKLDLFLLPVFYSATNKGLVLPSLPVPLSSIEIASNTHTLSLYQIVSPRIPPKIASYNYMKSRLFTLVPKPAAKII